MFFQGILEYPSIDLRDASLTLYCGTREDKFSQGIFLLPNFDERDFDRNFCTWLVTPKKFIYFPFCYRDMAHEKYSLDMWNICIIYFGIFIWWWWLPLTLLSARRRGFRRRRRREIKEREAKQELRRQDRTLQGGLSWLGVFNERNRRKHGQWYGVPLHRKGRRG